MLGPNGAGKTTGVRILTTLTAPDGGRAWVAGHDVVSEAAAVRRKIGVTGQDATLDEALTGRQNLVMVGELSRLRRSRGAAPGGGAARALRARPTPPTGWSRATPAACAGASTWPPAWSTRPPVLFLDEPTTGLDPTSRQRMWGVIRGLVADGVTLWLTTQYLDEADALADRIAVIDHGRVIAEGTPRELKAATGSQLLEVTLAAPTPARRRRSPPGLGAVKLSDDGRRLRAPRATSRPGGGRAAGTRSGRRAGRRHRRPPAVAGRRVRRADRRGAGRAKSGAVVEGAWHERHDRTARRRRRAGAASSGCAPGGATSG